jgi:hypothetical protein
MYLISWGNPIKLCREDLQLEIIIEIEEVNLKGPKHSVDVVGIIIDVAYLDVDQ